MSKLISLSMFTKPHKNCGFAVSVEMYKIRMNQRRTPSVKVAFFPILGIFFLNEVTCLKVSSIYRISSAIRPRYFYFRNNPKDLDPSYKTDLDL